MVSDGLGWGRGVGGVPQLLPNSSTTGTHREGVQLQCDGSLTFF